MFCLDLLSRILRITDILMNHHHFGFANSADGWHVKIIDFKA